MRSWIFALALVAACETPPAESPRPAEPAPPEPATAEPEPSAPAEEPQPVGDATPGDPEHAKLHALLEAMWTPNDQGEIPAEATPNFQKALLQATVYVPETGEPRPYTEGPSKGWMVAIAPNFIEGPSKGVPSKEIMKAAVAKGLGIYWDGGNVFTFMTSDELKKLLR